MTESDLATSPSNVAAPAPPTDATSPTGEKTSPSMNKRPPAPSTSTSSTSALDTPHDPSSSANDGCSSSATVASVGAILSNPATTPTEEDEEHERTEEKKGVVLLPAAGGAKVEPPAAGSSTTVGVLRSTTSHQEILTELNDLHEFGETEEGFDYTTTDIRYASDLIVEQPNLKNPSLPDIKVRSTKPILLPKKFNLWYNSMRPPPKAIQTKGQAKGATPVAFDYTALNEKVCEFKTIQDFWRIMNSIQFTSGILGIFKDPVKPEWEDEYAKNGGRFILNTISSNDRYEYFLDIALALIADYFKPEYEGVGDDHLLGVVLKVMIGKKNKGWSVEVWNSNGQVGLSVLKKMNVALRRVINREGDAHGQFVIEYKSFNQGEGKDVHEVFEGVDEA